MEGYKIEREGNRVLLRGPVPVDDFAALTKMWKKQGLTAMAIGVGNALGATAAICRDEDVAVWEQEIAASVKAASNGDAEIEWLRGTDTGLSSITLLMVLGSSGRVQNMAEGRLGRWGATTPSDPSDFGRCYRLLQRFPAWRERLGEVATKYPQWKPLTDAWDELTALWEEEAPTGTCRKLYDRMKELLREK